MIIIMLCHADHADWETQGGVKYKKYTPDIYGKSDKAGNLVNLTTKWMDVTLYGHIEEYTENVKQSMGGTKNIAGSYGERVLCTGNNPEYVASNSFELPDVIPFKKDTSWDDFYKLINKTNKKD